MAPMFGKKISMCVCMFACVFGAIAILVVHFYLVVNLWFDVHFFGPFHNFSEFKNFNHWYQQPPPHILIKASCSPKSNQIKSNNIREKCEEVSSKKREINETLQTMNHVLGLKLYFEGCGRIWRVEAHTVWQSVERRGIANRPTEWRSAADSQSEPPSPK